MDYIHLVGADDVKNAGYAMKTAADDMRNAASNLAFALECNQRFLDDWLARFRDVVETLGGVEHAR